MWLVGSKPIRSWWSESRSIFCTHGVMCHALWHHLSSLPYQFLIFEDVGAFDSSAIIGSTSTHPTKGQLPKIIMWFSDISYITENINLLSEAQFQSCVIRWWHLQRLGKRSTKLKQKIMHFLKQHLFPSEQAILIFLIQPQITQVIPAVTSSPLAFLFDLHFTTIPRFDSKRYQMVFALSINYPASRGYIFAVWDGVRKVNLSCENQTKITILPPATTFFF